MPASDRGVAVIASPQTPQSPELPNPLVVIWADPEAFGDHSVIELGVLNDLDLSAQIGQDVTFDRAVMRRCNLSECSFKLAQLLDARLDGCDVANARWEKTHIQRAEITGCRLVGWALIDSQVANLLVQRCNADLSRFHDTAFHATCFEACTLKSASFEGADLRGVVFRGCDLRGADFRRAKLKGTDLRGCDIDGIKIGVGDVKGLIVSPQQAVELAALFGVDVRAEA